MGEATLNISTDLRLPRDTVTQTLVVYGGKGMGKTNLGGVLVEELAKNHQRFVVIDPIGCWYGLQHSADGKGPGLSVLVLGGTHGDLPIEPTGGAVVADLVADEDVDVVIDISRRPNGIMWSLGERTRFVTDYCIRLYERQGERRRPIMQVIDEAGRFVPQMIPHGAPEIAKCVGAIERMVEEGRNVGIGVCLITQRSARMNKSVSELAECMMAFRTVGPRSVDAILDWFGEHVEKARWKELVEKLRSLPRGHALVVSPGWLNFEGVARIRMRETFDSSATPSSGEERRLSGKGAAKPDLAKYLQRMADTIEKAKADDPHELRKRIAELEADLHALRVDIVAGTSPPTTWRCAVCRKEDEAGTGAWACHVDLDQTPVHTGKCFAAYNAQKARGLTPPVDHEAIGMLESSRDALSREIGIVEQILARLRQPVVDVTAPPLANGSAVRNAADARLRAIVRESPVMSMLDHPRPAATHAQALKGGAPRKILNVLAQYPQGRTKIQLAMLTGYAHSGGGFNNAIGALRSQGLITGDNQCLQLTVAGRKAVGHVQPLPKGRALLEMWLGQLGRAERLVLETLATSHPRPMTKEQIASRTGYEATGGGFANALGRLRTLELIHGRGELRVNETLMGHA